MRFRLDYFVVGFSVCLALVLFFTSNPGLLVTDEVAYLLTVDTLYKYGGLGIYNGNDEVVSQEMLFPGTIYFLRGGLYRIYCIAAPLYAFVALPFYHFFGIDGLVVMNIFFFALTVVVVYYLALLVVGSGRHAVVSSLAYSLTSYTLQYTRTSIPQMLSVFLVSASAYLFLRHHLVRRDERVLFYSGVLLGLSFGVRQPNVVLIAVALFFAYRFFGWRDLMVFLGGCGLGVLPTLALNQIYYGNFLLSGYITSLDVLSGYLKAFFLGLSFFVFFAVVCSRLGKSIKTRRNQLLLVSVFLVFLIVFRPQVLDSLYYRLGLFYAKIFDMTKLGDAYRETVYIKKALLQSTPYLILGFFAFLTPKEKRREDAVYFISALAFSNVLFYSVFSAAVGGIDETYGIRYFSEAMPFLIILSVFSLRGWIDKIRARDAVFFMLAFIAFTFLLYLKRGLVYPADWNLRILPTVASLALLSAYIKNLDKLHASRLFAVILAFAVAFSVVVAYHDTESVNRKKVIAYSLGNALEGVVGNDSVILVPHYSFVLEVIKPRFGNQTILYVFPGNDDYADTFQIVSYYKQQNKTIYVYNPVGRGEGWDDRIMEVVSKADYDRMLWFNVTQA